MPNKREQSEVPRKEISELLALYALEASLFDVFVEGVRDRGIIESFLTNITNIRRVRVYSIDAINVPGDVVRKYGYNPSNRNEVLTLCRALHERDNLIINNAVGIIDSDFD